MNRSVLILSLALGFPLGAEEIERIARSWITNDTQINSWIRLRITVPNKIIIE